MKLRITKERVESSEPFDQDLRGIGDQEFLTAGYPVCRLLHKGTHTLSTSELDICRRYGIKVTQIDKTTHALTVSSMHAHAHKKHAVYLFIAALELGITQNKAHGFHLEEVRPFHHILHNSIRKNSPLSTDIQKVITAPVTTAVKPNSLTIQPVCANYLQEAGFSFSQKQLDGSVELDRNSQILLAESLSNDVSATSHSRKVG